jgi:threonine synthase
MPDSYIEAESLLVRYSGRLSGLSPESISAASVQEGAAILRGYSYKGVEISMLDMSSYCATSTFKALVACATIAWCLDNGIKAFITQTSGNTGNALAVYAARVGIHIDIFYPAFSRYKINPAVTSSEFVRFTEVEGTEPELKDLTKETAERLGLPWLPDLRLQLEANKARAWFIEDCWRDRGWRFDWHVQALSSGYGVFGFYTGVSDLLSQAASTTPPRLLGVQQESVRPYFNDLNGLDLTESSGEMIEPTLFRTRPSEELLNWMRRVVESSRGTVTMVNYQEYLRYRPLATQILDFFRLPVSRVGPAATAIPTEQAGLMALIGTLKEIDSQTIVPGDAVLVCITGGAGPDRDEVYMPERILKPNL